VNHEHPGQDQEYQMCRRREPLHGSGRKERSARHSQAWCGGVGHSAADLVDVEHAGTDGTDGRASRQALHDSGREKGCDAVGVGEDQQGQDLVDLSVQSVKGR
jgi:hypothetical protein